MAFETPMKALLVEDNTVHTLVPSMMLDRFHPEISVAKMGKKMWICSSRGRSSTLFCVIRTCL
jgi:hypothetical protein